MKETLPYYIRQLSPADLEAYRAVRLEALQLEPGVFGSNYGREAAFTTGVWQQRLSRQDAASFGLFYAGELVGITGIIIQRPGEGALVASYIRKEYRKRGLSAMLYEARLTWARDKGLKTLVVSHRKSNQASMAANRHFGFRYTHTQMTLWPDGQEEEELFYILAL